MVKRQDVHIIQIQVNGINSLYPKNMPKKENERKEPGEKPEIILVSPRTVDNEGHPINPTCPPDCMPYCRPYCRPNCRPATSCRPVGN